MKIKNIRFICCSDMVSALDMAVPLSHELQDLEMHAYDSVMKKHVLVMAPLMCILADNNRASELLNHLCSSSRKYCRMCMVRKIQDLFYICI